MCAGYQTGTYSITMYGNNGAVVDHFGPIKYTQENNSEQMLIVKGLRPDLILGSQYEVEVTVESLGIFRSQRKNFSKMESICVKLQIIYLLHLASPPPHQYTRPRSTPYDINKAHNYTGTRREYATMYIL